MAKSNDVFSDHHHNMTVAMQIFHGSHILHHKMLTMNRESKKGRKNEAFCDSARSDENGQR